MTTAQRLSTKQLQEVFGVAHMTIHNWRAGNATKDPLPFETDIASGAEKPRVWFKVSQVKQWAKKHDVKIAKDPEKVLAAAQARDGKPGPKPRKQIKQ